MNKNICLSFIIIAGLFFNSCKNNDSENNQSQVNKEIKTDNEKARIEEKETNEFFKQSVDDELANRIKNYINTKFLTEGDLRAITDDQRKFQLYKIDLNNDGKEEIFVNFITSYFCGTGGCTVLLLNSNLDLITSFSPTRTFYVDTTSQNDWKVLQTETEGKWRKLSYENGSYPTNPTVLEATDESPSENAEILFDDDLSNAKTYSF